MIIPVLLSGGYGTRLWPLSRKKYPKQFINNLISSSPKSLFASHLEYCNRRHQKSISVVSNDHIFFVKDECLQSGMETTIVTEPISKNTLPAILASCLSAQALYGSCTLLCMPCDHILDYDELDRCITIASQEIKADPSKIFTFGIQPTAPSDNFGYIMTSACSQNVLHIDKFIEKPSLEVSKTLIENGALWNAGIFMFDVDNMLEEIKSLCPSHYNQMSQLNVNQSGDTIIPKALYQDLEDIAFDYAVMQKTDKGHCVRFNSHWNDIGNFASLESEKKSDKHFSKSSDGNFVMSYCDREIVTIGVNNSVIVDTSDALLICNKENIGEIKNILPSLPEDIKNTRKRVYKPWGYYEVIHQQQGVKTKIIHLKPHSSISLQMHYKRKEIWTVIEGEAEVQVEDTVKGVKCGESVVIEIGQKHRLVNKTDTNVRVVEIQMGSEVVEEDIVRFDDLYNRTT